MGERLRLLFLGLLVTAGCSNRDAERIGGISGKAFDRAGAVTRHAGERIALVVRTSRPDLDSIELAARVSYRLKWDQVLEGASVRVDANGGGVTLTGSVRDDVQRQRARDLAQSTLGVERITESLEVTAARP